MPGGKHVLGQSRDRHIFGTVKVGEKGQIVIPKEARTVFGIRPGGHAARARRRDARHRGHAAGGHARRGRKNFRRI